MAMLCALIFVLFSSAFADFTQPGKISVEVNEKSDKGLVSVKRAMYNMSGIVVKVLCPDMEGETQIRVDWQMISSPCAQQFQFDAENAWRAYHNNLVAFSNMPQLSMKRARSPTTITCHRSTVDPIDGSLFEFTPPSNAVDKEANTKDTDGDDQKNTGVDDQEDTGVDDQKNTGVGDQKNTGVGDQKNTGVGDQEDNSHREDKKQNRRRRSKGETTSKKTTTIPKIANADDNGKTPETNPTIDELKKSEPRRDVNAIVAWVDGMYLLNIRITPVEEDAAFNATVEVEMEGPRGGFLDAIDWPLLPFYGCMCAVYIILAMVWLVLLCCNWRDLLRIQFWIGGVILLGMIEKAMFLAEYESIDKSGHSVRGAVIAATMVSCLKRALARMLVLIASVGFGIVKPRLGPMLNKVLAMGALFFILSAVEGCLRVTRDKSDTSKSSLLSEIPLAVLDSAICWWIFTGLVDTLRTLRLRRNLVKLSLYRHFTNTLIFAVIASVGYMVWTIWKHKLSNCMTDWKELWVDDAFWHLLFSVVLIIIMFLWRPTANNQRYAFSPLLDAADKDAEEPMISDAFDGVKMRPKSVNGEPKIRDHAKTTEDDLKWIEENIPASVADSAIPSILDSDEEIMTTKFEISKME